MDVIMSREGHVGVIMLNRPEHLNAFTMEMIDQWALALQELARDDQCRAVVLTGAGKAFCSGVEVGNLESDLSPLDRKKVLVDHVHKIPLTLDDMDKPIIAAINGTAVGAGLDMALMCDLRLIAESARVSEGYVRVGLVPGDGGAYYLPKLVGIARALELLWTGEFIGGGEAERVGLVNRCVPDQDLMPTAMAWAQRISEQSPLVVRTTKRIVYQSQRTDLRTALDLVSSHMGILQSTQDYREALAAFREKRTGQFEGR